MDERKGAAADIPRLDTREGPTLRPDPQTTFRDLYQRHSGSVYGYASRRTSPQDAQDIVAETFLVAWRRIGDIPDDALPWLFGVARRVLSNARRGSDRRSSLGARLRFEARPSAEDDPADEVTSKAAVLSALQRLSPAEHEALTLVAWEGLDITRAARAVGCTKATFSVRLHRARRRMMKELAAGGHQKSVEGTPSDGFEEAQAR
jgi:RNA polymerase sigma factor (sigma-70 family)